MEEGQRQPQLLSHNLYREDLGQTPIDSLIFAGSHESRSVDSVDRVFAVSLSPLVPLIIPPLLQDSPNSA